MTKPKLVAFIGFSRSGKDTVASAFKDRGYRQYNISTPMKRAVEGIYGLPEGAMERDYYRQQIVPRTGTMTFLDLMVEFARAWRAIDPFVMVTPGYKYLRDEVRDTVMTGIRYLEEVEMLGSLRDVYDVTLVHVVRPGIRPLAPDRSIPICLDYAEVIGLQTLTLENNGTLDQWIHKTQELYAQIHSTQAT